MIVKKEQGVTLIELMIVLVIAAFLVAGIYSLFITQHRSYTVQDQVAGVQQDARVALDIMARDIRVAGFLIGSQGFNVNGAQFAVTPNNPGGTDSITVAAAADEFMSGTNPVTVTNVTGNVVAVSASNSEINGFFDTGANSFVVFEGDSTHAIYQISGITGQTLTLSESPPTYLATVTDSTGSVVGARVFRAKSITYRVQSNTLQRSENGGAFQPLAGDGINTSVEDLQFAYQVAGSNTWIFDSPAHTWPAGNTFADIRMVRINIIVKTAVPDPKETSFFKPACEDRGQVNSDPGNRRRVYTTVVKVRNLK
ncbi:MAG: PilW family protein [Deltaproteobacteria bacterium]|nr:PilW family protein [Deltaproteobacteria bacterium]